MYIKFFVLAFAIALTTACQMAPKKHIPVSEGEWTAKVLVKDIAKSNSHIINLDIAALKMSALRMNITTPAGMHVASLAMKEDNIEYVLMRDKRLIRGKSNSKALKPLIEVPLDPMVLHNVVFDIPIENPDWNCQIDPSDFPVQCTNEKEGLIIEWSDRAVDSKLVKILHSKAELQMKFMTYKPNVENPEKVFTLKVPKGFKIYTLR